MQQTVTNEIIENAIRYIFEINVLEVQYVINFILRDQAKELYSEWIQYIVKPYAEPAMNLQVHAYSRIYIFIKRFIKAARTEIKFNKKKRKEVHNIFFQAHF